MVVTILNNIAEAVVPRVARILICKTFKLIKALIHCKPLLEGRINNKIKNDVFEKKGKRKREEGPYYL